MLIDPNRHRLQVYDGTRMLAQPLGLEGVQLTDPQEPERVWTVQSVYAPIVGLTIQGVRARAVDTKGFVSFINQRDLEVLLGLGKPTTWCPWLGDYYADPTDDRSDWYGFCLDGADMQDDLQQYELMLVDQYGYVPDGYNVVRRLHVDPDNDVEELVIARAELEPVALPSIQTITRRWSSVERIRVQWDRVYAAQ